MNNNNNATAEFDMFTFPCMFSCGSALIALFIISRMSYTLGANIKDRGNQTYQRAFWTLCIALSILSSAFATVKFFE